jgi:putative transposase
MKKRFTEEQIIKVLQKNASGSSAKEVCREFGISAQTFYSWKKKFDGMDASEARKLRSLEAENQKLKRLVADLSLDNQMLKDINSKKF